MPIYTCNNVSSGAAPSIFQEKGILNSTSARIDDCGIHVLPTTTLSEEFISSTNNLAHYGVAYESEAAVMCDTPYRAALQSIDGFSVTPVVCAVQYPNCSEEDKEMMKAHGMTEAPGDRKNVFIGSISYTQVKSLAENGVPFDNRTPAGNPPLGGALAYYMGWKAVTLYAGFIAARKEVGGWYRVGGIEEREMGEGFIRDGYRGDGEGEVHKVFGKDDIELAGVTAKRIQDVVRVIVVPRGGLASQDEVKIGFDYEANQPGQVFPYFDGLLEPSKDFSMGVFFRYFSRAYAANQQSMATLTPILRQGFRSVATSSQGRSLSHALYGLQASIESGASIRYLFTGSIYRGFVLEGDFVVLKKGVMVYPIKAEELTEEIAGLDAHRTALEDVARILSIVALKDGGGHKEVPVDKISTSRMLANEFKIRRTIILGEAPAGLQDAVKRLQFGETSWRIDIPNLLLAVKAMTTNGELDGPFYPIWENLITEDPIRRALAVFGKTAPSVVLGTKTVLITPAGKKCQNLEKDDKGLDHMRYIPVYEVATTTAVNDWRSIQQRHMMKVVAPVKKGFGGIMGYSDRSKDYCIASGEDKIPLYEAIRVFAYAGGYTKVVGEKRKGKDTDRGEGSSKKQKETSAAFSKKTSALL